MFNDSILTFRQADQYILQGEGSLSRLRAYQIRNQIVRSLIWYCIKADIFSIAMYFTADLGQFLPPLGARKVSGNRVPGGGSVLPFVKNSVRRFSSV
jgi:hypothetical protein